MNKELQDRVITAINGYLPTPVNDFVEDHKKDTQALLNLVITLKHWSNPLGSYSLALDEKKRNVYFDYVQKILADPKKLLSQEKNLTADDEKKIGELVRIKLNKIALEIIDEYKLQHELDKRIQYNAQAAQAWWNQKSTEEKKQIQQYYNNLNPQQKSILAQRTSNYATSVSINVTYVDSYTLYQMCNGMAHLTYYTFEGLAQLTQFSIRAAGSAVHAIAHAAGNISVSGGGGGCGGGGGGCSGDGAAIAAAIAAFIALITAGFIGGAYAIKKICNSVINIGSGDKVPRSLFRLAGIGAGGFLGAMKGAAVGAALGSIIPGFGSLAGAIIGGIFGAGLGAGLGALAAKYTAKLVSAIFNSNELNPTNPEKYKLSDKQKMHLTNNGFDLAIINQIIAAIKQEKDQIGINGSFAGSKEREQKDALNALLKQVKNGEIRGRVKVGNMTFDPQLTRFDASPKHKEMNSSTALIIASPLNDGEFNIQASAPPLSPSRQAKPIASAPERKEEAPQVIKAPRIAL